MATGEIIRPDALELVLPGACGVELAHAASLILDDLPSKDGAELRRGRPCAHLVFPHWAVDMAPVFLINLAYQICLENPLAPCELRVAAALELAKVGHLMIAGQAAELDCPTAENGDEQALLDRYRRKTGALFAAGARTAALLCGATEEQTARLDECVLNLGLSYQFLDDIADAVASADELGKRTGVDADRHIAVSFYGLDGARAHSDEFCRQAESCLTPFGDTAASLRALIGHASPALAS